MPNTFNNELGDVSIQNDVIAQIAVQAAKKIKGIIGMHGKFLEDVSATFSNKSKGIKVENLENGVNIFLNLVVIFGASIPEITWQVQKNVKENVEKMTGINVLKVNVEVVGVVSSKPENEETTES